MYKSILVAIDGSDAANRGLSQAIELAKHLGGRIRVINVVNKMPLVSPGTPAEVMDRLVDELRGNAESLVHEAVTQARASGIDVDSRIIESIGDRAGQYIVDEARAWPAQLIVCGTHGRRARGWMLMGNDAEYVVRHSTVPVLIVRSLAASG